MNSESTNPILNFRQPCNCADELVQPENQAAYAIAKNQQNSFNFRGGSFITLTREAIDSSESSGR